MNATVCDHCGKVIIMDRNYNKNCKKIRTYVPNQVCSIGEYDVCINCFDEFFKWVNEPSYKLQKIVSQELNKKEKKGNKKK